MDTQFQTPIHIISYMCSMIPPGTKTILEPSAGTGNMLSCLTKYDVTAPVDFFQMEKKRYDCVMMNPPFTSKSAFGVPSGIEYKGMKLGYHFLLECMKMSHHVIAIMPWFTISDSDLRLRFIKSYGLKSITALPRKTFHYARIQTCVLELHEGYRENTVFHVFNHLSS